MLAVAPSIVEGAKKLWSNVTKTEKSALPATPQLDDKLSFQSDALSAIEVRLCSLESRITEIVSEAVSSSELIRSLAEQNSKLVQAVEILRVQTRALVWLVSALVLATLALFLWVLLH